jgi:hypothetical protein
MIGGDSFYFYVPTCVGCGCTLEGNYMDIIGMYCDDCYFIFLQEQENENNDEDVD